ncbi:MAG TPA: pyruvate dehydrogenase complex dihydrolipoamide acetyltransferase [Xanthobacteraceae bacterium]|jgi:pyruvate dehydrogenase E2 component (dihydrolipoamide acetyltransferase)|nr:pyruvate dehydrogenase complex dihydrolipoamide acetyltransferase [Xanthobacteraceae bacterium]
MPINILMPALSPTMEKGNLAKWLKKEGDAVKTGDVIAEIETDKATMEYEAVDDGVMAKIVVPEGTNDVAVNQLIAVMAQEGEDVKAAAAGAGQGATPAARAPSPPPSPPRGEGAAQQAAAPSTSAPAPQEAKSPPPPAPPRAPSPQRGEGGGEGVRTNGHGAGSGTNRIFSSPLARRLAKDANIELGRIQGTGPHGRVIARDVEAAKSGQGLRAPAAAPAGAPLTAPSMSDQQVRALYDDGSYDFVPHDGMRRTIAQRLTASVQTIPHFYLTIDCDIGKLLEAREEINAAAPKDKDGKPAYKLSVNDFVIKALALALQRVPDANVSWTDAGMLKHKHSDVGVAVAMPNGLITPIIRNAEAKSLSAISNEMKELAGRARARKLKPHEYQGGTTSVSNLGMYGIKDFTAVINPPQSTILAVGTGEERAVVRGGKIEAAHIMSVTMSCDHRSVDGALGAVLIGAFKALIENPVMMLV